MAVPAAATPTTHALPHVMTFTGSRDCGESGAALAPSPVASAVIVVLLARPSVMTKTGNCTPDAAGMSGTLHTIVVPSPGTHVSVDGGRCSVPLMAAVSNASGLV